MKYLYFFIPLFGVLFYYPSFFYGFSQDDFIHINASRVSSVSGFLNFFNPFYQFPDIFFFRPLATQVYFFINESLFGSNPIPFRIESLLLHTANGIIFYLLILKFWQNKNIALISAVLYEISAIHFLSLFYISSFQQIARTFFILLSILLFIIASEKRSKKIFLGSSLSFAAALLSKETGIILPLLLPLIEVFRSKQNFLTVLKKNLPFIIPFFLVAIFYLLIRSLGFQSIFNQGSYELSFSLGNFVQNIKWYILWGFGLPEILATYPNLGMGSLIQFGKDFSEAKIILPGFILFLLSALFSIWLIFRKSLSNFFEVINLKYLIILGLLFFIPLLPVVFLYQHKYPQYLDIPIMIILPFLSYLFIKTFQKNKLLAIVLIASFITLQFFSLKLTENTHWTTHRSEVASYYKSSFIQKHNNIPHNSSIALIGNKQATQEVSHALAGKYAFLAWYPYAVKDVLYLNSEDEIKEREKLIIFHLDKY